MTKPIFTITGKESGKIYKIYLNGTVEGFDEDVSIFNQIPTYMSKEVHTNRVGDLHKLVEKISEYIDYFPCEKLEDYFSVNRKASSYSVDEHSLLSKPNFSIRTVECSKAKEDK